MSIFRKKTEDFIEAKLTGGLGNQLFIFAAGYSLARKYDCKLILDTSDFGPQNPRTLEIGHFQSEQVVFEKGAVLHKKSGGRELIKYREKGFNFSEDFLTIRPGTRIEGYFQSPKYFENNEEDILNFLNRSNLSDIEEKTISDLTDTGNVSVHIRRGDYLENATKEYHGITSEQYFNRATKLMASLQPNSSYTIFTDSPESLSVEFYRDSGLSLGRDQVFDIEQAMSSWATLKAMSKGKGIIMSNSSFSWWAAWLMSIRSQASVIAPRPWFAKAIETRDLLARDWLTLDARP